MYRLQIIYTNQNEVNDPSGINYSTVHSQDILHNINILYTYIHEYITFHKLTTKQTYR